LIIFLKFLTGKSFPAENITISSVKNGEVEELTKGQKTKLRVKILGTTLLFGSFLMMGRLYLKKRQEFYKQQLKELDGILEYYQGLIVDIIEKPDTFK